MQNETTENKNPIDLNEIVFLFWDKAAADQDTPYFDFVKAHDQILMTKIKKYSNDIQKMNLEGMVPEKMESVIESVSTDLYDSITQANLDYLRQGKTPPMMNQLKYKFYEKTIYSLLKKTIGIENGNFFPTAGAAVPDEINEFVHSVGINMVVGYGLTESTATVSCTLPVGYDIGSVGVVLPGIEVKIGEDNEILLRGKTITKGYYKKAEATAAAIDADGWFHTGDAGYFKNGQLFLMERIKDLFKTSNGKYIAPQALETKLVIDRYIDQIAIIADRRKFVSALIVPVYGYVKEYAKEKGIEYKDMADLLRHPKIVGLFRARIETLQQQFAHYEQIKRFTLLPEPFSMERGELTNTLKLKRSVVSENYKDLIEKMYEENA